MCRRISSTAWRPSASNSLTASASPQCWLAECRPNWKLLLSTWASCCVSCINITCIIMEAWLVCSVPVLIVLESPSQICWLGNVILRLIWTQTDRCGPSYKLNCRFWTYIRNIKQLRLRYKSDKTFLQNMCNVIWSRTVPLSSGDLCSRSASWKHMQLNTTKCNWSKLDTQLRATKFRWRCN